MKILASFCAILACAPFAAAQQEDSLEKLENGFAYVHTARNAPVFKIDGKIIEAKRGSLIPASGLSVETSDGQYATLIFSNRTAVYLKGKAKITVESLEQVMPFSDVLSDDYESARSKLRLKIDEGTAYFASVLQRPTSRTVIKTKFGVLEPQSTDYCVSASPSSTSFSILNGQAVFSGLDGKRDFIHRTQTASVESFESDKMYPLKIEPITMLQESEMARELNLCRQAIQSVEFSFSPDGHLRVRRLVPKEFLTQMRK